VVDYGPVPGKRKRRERAAAEAAEVKRLERGPPVHVAASAVEDAQVKIARALATLDRHDMLRELRGPLVRAASGLQELRIRLLEAAG